jgi:hypothetical protein
MSNGRYRHGLMDDRHGRSAKAFFERTKSLALAQHVERILCVLFLNSSCHTKKRPKNSISKSKKRRQPNFIFSALYSFVKGF